jgi:hypothetical protein
MIGAFDFNEVISQNVTGFPILLHALAKLIDCSSSVDSLRG